MPPVGAVAYRIWKGDRLGLIYSALATAGISVRAVARVEYDNGQHDDLTINQAPATAGTNVATSDQRAKHDGWIVAAFTDQEGTAGGSWLFGELYIQHGEDVANANIRQVLGAGFFGQGMWMGLAERQDFRATFVFQGTIASDASVGTHVTTATITPGTGNEIQLCYGQMIFNGAAALASAVVIQDDAGNTITNVQTGSTAVTINFPFSPNAGTQASAGNPFIISGAQKFVMSLTTSTVSQTQTFAAAFRVKGAALPGVVLADTVGAPVLTTNTQKVF